MLFYPFNFLLEFYFWIYSLLFVFYCFLYCLFFILIFFIFKILSQLLAPLHLILPPISYLLTLSQLLAPLYLILTLSQLLASLHLILTLSQLLAPFHMILPHISYLLFPNSQLAPSSISPDSSSYLLSSISLLLASSQLHFTSFVPTIVFSYLVSFILFPHFSTMVFFFSVPLSRFLVSLSVLELFYLIKIKISLEVQIKYSGNPDA